MRRQGNRCQTRGMAPICRSVHGPDADAASRAPAKSSPEDLAAAEGEEALPGSSFFVPIFSNLPVLLGYAATSPQEFAIHSPVLRSSSSTKAYELLSSPAVSSGAASAECTPRRPHVAAARRRRAERHREEALRCAEAVRLYQARRLLSQMLLGPASGSGQLEA